MAFLVQDDSGSIANANAYITEAEFMAHHDDRGGDYSAYTSVQIQQAIVQATDYLDVRFRFVGERQAVRQRTAWPRLGAVDANDDTRGGVPHEVKEACADYALIAAAGTINPAPTLDATGRVVQKKREKVGPIEEETEYAGGAAFVMPKYPEADRRLTMSGLVVAGRTIRRA